MLMLFDTLTRMKRRFEPLHHGTAMVYTCGPSVYSFSHIGNFRTYLFEDVLVRYLIYKGFKVRRVMNITDVEDKAIEAARREGTTLGTLQNGKIKAFLADSDRLGMKRPDVIAKASEHVPQAISLIRRICAKGYCIDMRDGIYFDVRRFKRYGRLSGLEKPEYFGQAKGDDYAKEGLWDFRLWKRWTRGDGPVCWESPFGDGRPGWHIECSAMAMHYLGDSFDIHCGGTDNIYPHHENEIAQSEAASGKKLARFWLHARHLTVGRRKMSKRTGNVLYVRQLEKEGVPPKCLRFYLLSKRYRSQLDFTMESFGDEVCDCKKVRNLIGKLRGIGSSGDGAFGKACAKRLIEGFEKAMDDDLDTGLAFRRVFRVFHEIEARMPAKELSRKDALAILDAMGRIDSVLGVF
jgi:cysteinyl-tRNA synthetase